MKTGQPTSGLPASRPLGTSYWRQLQSNRLLLLLTAALLCAPLILHAQATTGTYPSWWAAQGILSGTTASDYAAANQGQAKNIALGAVNELYSDLAAFPAATAHLDSLAAYLYTSSTATGANDYSAINVGQLKTLTQPIYDALLTVSATSGPLETGTYPWAGTAAGDAPRGSTDDYAIANLGQLKFLFSFNPTADTNSNGLPDWWENLYSLPLTGTGAVSSSSFVPWSSNQITYLQAYQQGLNPGDYYSGHTPILIVSGSGQTGPAGGFLPAPLIVTLTDTAGNPLIGAPVTFTVSFTSPSVGGLVQLSQESEYGTSSFLFTDQNGQAKVYFQFPASVSGSTQITATAGPPSSPAHATFTEYVGTGPFASLDPSNVVVDAESDGSLDITWQNNTDSTADIVIYFKHPDGWHSTSVAAGTTFLHISAQ